MKPELSFIGNIETPYSTLKECPKNIQHDGPICQIKVYDEYREGLLGLVTGQTILILYWLGNTNKPVILRKTDNSNKTTGIFARRTPHRPNPIGVAMLPIHKIENGQITVRGLDCLNNTKLIDIKPAINNEADEIK
ncbi:MAG: tRNA (N6-threonylcarbamoyladenosine(37)-N6)-methyltransferase TrmO [Denitrovibrio sp.]|nr:MAG: tRNA (N6-threonylcarbamoyladenosine(37)-N6)-methyltransferase TrmO [Denitrovibrio sp.]